MPDGSRVLKRRRVLDLVYGRCGHHGREYYAPGMTDQAAAEVYRLAAESLCPECERAEQERTRPRPTREEMERDRALWG